MQAQDIRKNWIQFFSEKKKHLYLPSASFIPQNPTLLLTGAGMVPFVPYFLGQKKPPASRITSIQKCVRLGGKDSDLEKLIQMDYPPGNLAVANNGDVYFNYHPLAKAESSVFKPRRLDHSNAIRARPIGLGTS
jgi:hypothetical protein